MTVKPFRYDGRTFATKHALSVHLAGITGRTSVGCFQALGRLGDDPARVIDYYRAADEMRATAFRYNGLTFPTQRALGQHLMPLVGRSLSACLGKLKELGNDAEQVVQHFRQTDDLSRLGALAQELRTACQDGGFSRWEELTVLTSEHDPYRFDNPTGRAEAQWFADVVDRLAPQGAVHLRGLHYRLVSSTPIVLKPDGTPYRNTFADWVWLISDASAAGRWLGYVPFERILDERNDPPVLPDDDEDGLFSSPGMQHQLVSGLIAGTPDLDEAMPSIETELHPERQPYRIILYGEKSSLGPVLRPIRDRVNGELLLPTGESTTTMVFNLALRCVRDGRPAVIGYFGDFDPSGWQMIISIARKLQALKTLRFPTLDVRMYPIALTKEQCEDHGLPSTPLARFPDGHTRAGQFKDKRAAGWLAAWSREQTEIDALAAVHPEVLTQIADDFVQPFFDPTLATRTAAVARTIQDTADATLTAHPQYQVSREAIAAALAELDAANDALSAAQDEAMENLGDIELPPLPELPEPVTEAMAPEPLFTTDDDYTTASLKLKRHRALYPEDDE